MAHKFAELEAKMSKESIARSDALFRKKLVEMIFSEIRRSRGMSQEMLAQALHPDGAVKITDYSSVGEEKAEEVRVKKKKKGNRSLGRI